MMSFSKPTPSKSPTPPRKLGMPVRAPPRVSPSMLYSYSDTFEDSLTQRVVQYSDTFEESGTPKTRHYSDTFESEAADSYSDTFVDGTLATEQIHTRISDGSHSQTPRPDSKVYSYSETFDSSSSPQRGTYTDKTSWQSGDDSYTRYQSEESRTPRSDDSYSASSYTRRGSLKESEDETYSERESGSSELSEDQTLEDYSYTFEDVDTTRTEDPEKLRREAELLKLTEEAEGQFSADMLARLRQPHVRQSDASARLRQDKKDKEKEMDWFTSRYIKKKIHLLKKKKAGTLKQDAKLSPEKSLPRKPLEGDGLLIQDYGLDPALLERLKLKNILEDMEMAANEEIHDPQRCKECRAHQLQIDSAAAERNFVREKTRHVRQEIIEDRIQKHLIHMSSLALIGELARTLPKHTADPEDIFEKLNSGLMLSKSITQNRQVHGLD